MIVCYVLGKFNLHVAVIDVLFVSIQARIGLYVHVETERQKERFREERASDRETHRNTQIHRERDAETRRWRETENHERTT